MGKLTVMEEARQQNKSGIVQGVLVTLLVVASFAIGSLYTKVQYLEKNVAGRGTPTVAGAGTAGTTPTPTPPVVSLENVKDVFGKALVTFGDVGKKVLFVEIADPSCPYCHVAAGKNASLNSEIDKQTGRQQFTLVSDGGTYVAPVPEMKKLVDEGRAALAWIYTPGHGNGEMGTKALYCAFEKGKFWEVHDVLMTSAGYELLNNTVKNDKTKSGELADFLTSVFDAGQMKSCLDSGKYDSRLQEDVTLVSSLRVSGTPGFFINETKFAGAYSWKDMESATTAALK